MNETVRTGIFAGSFDPFTVGHASVVRRVLPLFDRLVIGVGVNAGKRYTASAAERVAAIRRVYADEPKVEVAEYNGLTVDFAKQQGAQFVVKGVRSVRDFEAERDQADINRAIGGIETILVCAEPGLGSVSSSVVRELRSYGKDVSALLP